MKRFEMQLLLSFLLIMSCETVLGVQTGFSKVPVTSGWRMEVTRSVGMDGTERYQNGYQAPFRIFQKIEFKDQVTKTDGVSVQEVDRTIETAEFSRLDAGSGQMMRQEIIPPGSRFRVSHTPYGSTLYDGNSGREIWDEEMVSAFSPPVIPKLWPQGELRKGQRWSYGGNELTARISLIDALGGRIDLAVEDIQQEPSTQLTTALIRGKLQTKVDLGHLVMDFNADVSIDLPLVLKIPFMVKFDGVLSGSGMTQNQYGQSIGFQVHAKGTYLQIAKPSNAILSMATSSAGHASGKESQVTGGTSFQKGKGGGGPVYRYHLYQDTTEKAFTVMIPDGWQVQGGIMKTAPDQIRTVVDGCGKKLHFAIFDPSSNASITYFPTEMYATSAPGTSIINIPAGQVLNGMVQMPALLTPAQYVRQVVFPSERRDVQNVQWGTVKSLDDLAAAWNNAFHAEDQVRPQVVAQSVEVTFQRNGIRFKELWTSLITSVTVYSSTIWMPDFTVVAGAPLDKAEALAPILKAVITSFRMDSTWLANASAQFDKCTKGVVATQEKIREMDRKIAKKMQQVQQEINRIDNEIVANRNNTRSVIQEHEHNTLMGRDKYEDTETGARYLIDMGYERNFTNGEKIIQTNDWTYEPPAGYRDMKNIRITDE